MHDFIAKPTWGMPPWTINFQPARHPLPENIDFAIVGGGFAGLSAAAWLRRIAPERSVALFESRAIGAGSSGYTGGMILGETAAGDLPGLGDVLNGYCKILEELDIEAELTLPGVWEIGRTATLANSPISWTDSGTLRASRQVPGGTVDPGMVVSGLARVAEKSGAQIFEKVPVAGIDREGDLVRLQLPGRIVRARAVLIATNAMSLELAGQSAHAQPKFTLAVATGPLSESQIRNLGLGDGKPFYTIDFPYLWGRRLRNAGVVFGAGLVHLENWRELVGIDITSGEAGRLIARLQERVRGLHPAMRNVQFTHQWGGPILIADHWRPIFTRHPQVPQVIVLGAFSGHGVAQSVYLGKWAAEALRGQKDLPDWRSAVEEA
jgi:glycine/D-amino acid oxidase-like deaminating enzyme